MLGFVLERFPQETHKRVIVCFQQTIISTQPTFELGQGIKTKALDSGFHQNDGVKHLRGTE